MCLVREHFDAGEMQSGISQLAWKLIAIAASPGCF